MQKSLSYRIKKGASTKNCPKCGNEMVRDVPMSKFFGDVAKVVLSAATLGVSSVIGNAVSSTGDYWTNERYYKCKNCGYKLYEDRS